MLGGELDYHASNVGIVTTKDAKGKDVHTAVKIDHGRSAMLKYPSEQDLRSELTKTFQGFKYNNIPFDVKKFKEAINEMSKISHEEIKTLVGSRIQKLREADFKIDVIPFDTYAQDKKRALVIPKPKTKELSDKNYEILEKHYTDLLENNIKVAKGLSKSLDIIEKIDFSTKTPNNLMQVKGHDPILFSIVTKSSIDGKDPIAFAAENSHKIKDQDPILFAIHHKLSIQAKDPLTFAAENDLKINGESPVDFAIKNSLKISGQEPVDFAIKNEYKIQNKDPVDWITNSSRPDKSKKLESAISKYTPSSLTSLLLKLKENSPKNEQLINVVEQQRKKLGLKFDQGSQVYDIMMTGDSEKLSQKLKKELINNNKKQENALNLQAIIDNCPNELLDKLTQVNEKMGSERKETFKDKLLKIIKIFTLGWGRDNSKIKNRDIQMISKQFEEVSKTQGPKVAADLNINKEDFNQLNNIREIFEVNRQKIELNRKDQPPIAKNKASSISI
jgi:hypothetical protein